MRLILALCLAAAPALAQDVPPAPDAAEEEDGFSLVDEGAKLILRGLMSEMQPALDEMGKALDEAGPMLDSLGEEIGPKISQLLAIVDDFRNYEAPVMLPNGDILIRRKPTPFPGEPVPGPNGEIDL